MAYWLWRAYDDQAQQTTGVEEANRYEAVALKILQRGLTPGPIDRIAYEEYKRLLPYQTRINRLEEFKRKLQPNDEIPPARGRFPQWMRRLAWHAIGLLVVGTLSVALVYHYWRH